MIVFPSKQDLFPKDSLNDLFLSGASYVSFSFKSEMTLQFPVAKVAVTPAYRPSSILDLVCSP